MLTRKERRAAEHAARKSDRQTGSPTVSDAQLTANRANAQKSTGAQTEAGKLRSSMNAVKTGITGRIMILSSEEAPIYQTHLDRYFTKYTPATDDERDLVQSIADDHWRLLRIAPTEQSIYTMGRDLCAHLVENEKDPVKREGALLGIIYLTYKKDLSNLALQLRRIENRIERLTEKLEALQKARHAERQADLACAKRSIDNCQTNNCDPDFQTFGFDFSVKEFELYQIRRNLLLTMSGGKTLLNFDQFLTKFRSEAQEEVA